MHEAPAAGEAPAAEACTVLYVDFLLRTFHVYFNAAGAGR